MPTNVLSVQDGPRITVNTFINNPLMIPARVLDLLANQFLSEALLRDAGPNPSGLVSYEESSPLYLGSDVEEVAEFAEIPVGAGQAGIPRVVMATKRALGVRISREMRDEGQVDKVNRQITQLVNTFIRAEERIMATLLTNPAIPTIAAGAAWDTGTGRPRRDLANAAEEIASAGGDGDDESLGFDANTVVMPGAITPTLMDNDNFVAVYKDGLAAENIAYTGKLPNQVMGFDALRTRSAAWPKDRVLVLERGTVGFYSDSRALESTGLYGEGGGPNGGPTESWRSDTSRKRAYGIDQPLAACWITGVTTP